MKSLSHTLELTMLADFATPRAPQAPAEASTGAQPPTHDLLAQVGEEVAGPLTRALELVTILSSTGRIDRAGLRALCQDIDQARQAGIASQQIARLAGGRIRQSHERVHLTNTLQSVLAHRARELRAHGLSLGQSLQALEVQVDASMLYSLLNALVGWWLDAAQGQVEVTLDTSPWPTRARLSCRFRQHPDDVAGPSEMASQRLDTLRWRLLEQNALSLDLVWQRQVQEGSVHLSLEFPRTITALLHDQTDDATSAGTVTGFSDSINSQPLAGQHVLVLTPQRDVRTLVREAVRHMGLILDFAGSVTEAAAFCREVLPHAIVLDTALSGPSLDKLLAGIRAEVPEFVAIEILPEGRAFEISGLSQTGMARVGKAAVSESLPSALVYELSRNM